MPVCVKIQFVIKISMLVLKITLPEMYNEIITLCYQTNQVHLEDHSK